MQQTQNFTQCLYLDRRGATENSSPYARVNRALFEALAKSSEIQCVSREDAPLALRAVLAGAGQKYVTLTHSLLTVKNPLIGSFITIPYFDAEEQSESFYEQCRVHCDDIWFTSEQTRLQAFNHGIASEKTHLLNLGFDPCYFSPFGPKLDYGLDNKFIFLYIGSLESLSDVTCMLEAYISEFSSTDPVILLLHLWPSLDSRETEAQLLNLEKRFQRPGLAQLARLHGDFDATQTAALYRTAHVLLHPQRHDYASLQLIEAAASALPIMKPRRQGERLSRFHNLVQWIPESRSSSKADDLQQWRCLMRYATEELNRIQSSAQTLASQVSDLLTWDESVISTQQRTIEVAQRYPWHIRQPPSSERSNVIAYEGMVFSQNGEDGMLYEVFQRLRIPQIFLVEIGTETGSQCNAAFWIQVLSAQGLLIEANPQHVAILKNLYADYPGVRCLQNHVTSQSIADLFVQYEVPTDFDLLSIDIDGNDFHIWSALSKYRPKVVIIEYNAFYPPPETWVMADNPQHSWNGTTYYGASLMALVRLGQAMGYNLLCCNSTGVNAIFLREDLQTTCEFPVQEAQNAFRRLPWSYLQGEGPAMHANDFAQALNFAAMNYRSSAVLPWGS